FARRREKQAANALEAAADTAVRVLGPYAGKLDAVVLGGDRRAGTTVRADTRLRPLLTHVVDPLPTRPHPPPALLHAPLPRRPPAPAGPGAGGGGAGRGGPRAGRHRLTFLNGGFPVCRGRGGASRGLPGSWGPPRGAGQLALPPFCTPRR